MKTKNINLLLLIILLSSESNLLSQDQKPFMFDICMRIGNFIESFYPNSSSNEETEDYSNFEEKLLIFDFDGTLANSLQLVFEGLKKYSNYYKFKKSDGTDLKDEDLENLRKLGARQIMKEIGMNKLWAGLCCCSVRRHLSNNLDKINIIEGIDDMLEKLKNKGYKLVIMSSNSKENIECVLGENNLIKYFDEIYCGGIFDLLNKDKMLKKILEKSNINPKNAFYIGDEVRDIEACNGIVTIIVVGWPQAYNTLETLEAAAQRLKVQKDSGYFIAQTPDDIVKILCMD